MFQDIPRPGLWKRLLLGGFLVIFAAAGATAVAAFHEVDKVVSALKEGTELRLGKNTLATTDPGKPQTILILGSDRRAVRSDPRSPVGRVEARPRALGPAVRARVV